MMTLHLVSPHFVGMCRLQENCAGLMVRTVQCKQVNGSESHSLVIRIQMGMVVPTLALPGEPDGARINMAFNSTIPIPHLKKSHTVNCSQL